MLHEKGQKISFRRMIQGANYSSQDLLEKAEKLVDEHFFFDDA